jgi:phosphoribosylglycinamide formyltransferase 2
VVNLAPSASHVIQAQEQAAEVGFEGVGEALQVPGTKLRLFGKPDTRKNRRMGVVLAFGADTDDARQKAEQSAHKVRIVKLS